MIDLLSVGRLVGRSVDWSVIVCRFQQLLDAQAFPLNHKPGRYSYSTPTGATRLNNISQEIVFQFRPGICSFFEGISWPMLRLKNLIDDNVVGYL